MDSKATMDEKMEKLYQISKRLWYLNKQQTLMSHRSGDWEDQEESSGCVWCGQASCYTVGADCALAQ
jgi:hypothetical protein